LKFQRPLQTVFFIIIALLISSSMIALFKVPPLSGIVALFATGFGGYQQLGETLVLSTPLLIMAVGLSIPFSAKFWNIGGQGQYILGSILSTLVGLQLAGSLPPFLLILAAIVVGFIGGAVWAIPPTIMKLYLGTSEIITTLMMNFLAVFLLNYLVLGPMEGAGAKAFHVPSSEPIPPADMLARILPGTGLSLAFVLALLLAAFLYIVLNRTRFGYEIRLIGQSQDAAKYAGVRINRSILFAMVASGGLAGVAGMAQVFGATGVLLPQVFSDITTSFGYVGIPVALIAALNPISIVVSSIFFGGILNGAYGMELAYGIPVDVVIAVYGLIMLFALLGLAVDLGGLLGSLRGRFK
jgi:simple sugar transport system permease protein